VVVPARRIAESGSDLADFPLVEEYLDSPASNESGDLLTGIFMPSRAAT